MGNGEAIPLFFAGHTKEVLFEKKKDYEYLLIARCFN